MRNRMYGGVRGRKTKVGEKLLRFPPTRLFNHILSLIQTSEYAYSIIIFSLFKHLKSPAELSPSSGRAGSFIELTFLTGDEDAALS